MRTLSLAIMLLSAAATSVHAQGPRGGFRIDRFRLLGVQEVQDELGVTEEQGEAVRAAAEKVGPAEPPPGRRTEASPEQIQAYRSKLREHVEKERAALAEVLSTDQLQRLDQILLQLRGSAALENPELRASLGIDESQWEKLDAKRRELMTGMRQKMREIFEAGQGDIEAVREQMRELREDMEDQVLSLLNADQRAKLTDLKGKPFDLPMESLFRGWGGGRGDRDGRPQRPQRPAIE